jgi:hypothetical protein
MVLYPRVGLSHEVGVRDFHQSLQIGQRKRIQIEAAHQKAQPSTVATLACRTEWFHSWITTPARKRRR